MPELNVLCELKTGNLTGAGGLIDGTDCIVTETDKVPEPRERA